MLKRTSFYFIRHGQTDWNVQERAMGQTDIPLNETGIAQAYEAQKVILSLGIKTIITSPLIRAHKTAHIINEALKVPLIEHEGLKECNWGQQAGEIKRNKSDQPHNWRELWMQGHIILGAEKYEDFLKRSLQAINDALEHPGPVLIVAHGGIYWAIQHALNLGVGHTPNCVPIVHKPIEGSQSFWEVKLL